MNVFNPLLGIICLTLFTFATAKSDHVKLQRRHPFNLPYPTSTSVDKLLHCLGKGPSSRANRPRIQTLFDTNPTPNPDDEGNWLMLSPKTWGFSGHDTPKSDTWTPLNDSDEGAKGKVQRQKEKLMRCVKKIFPSPSPDQIDGEGREEVQRRVLPDMFGGSGFKQVRQQREGEFPLRPPTSPDKVIGWNSPEIKAPGDTDANNGANGVLGGRSGNENPLANKPGSETPGGDAAITDADVKKANAQQTATDDGQKQIAGGSDANGQQGATADVQKDSNAAAAATGEGQKNPAVAAAIDGDKRSANAADPNAVTPDPNATTSNPNTATPDPNAVTPDPNATTPNPNVATTDPDAITPDPNSPRTDPTNPKLPPGLGPNSPSVAPNLLNDPQQKLMPQSTTPDPNSPTNSTTSNTTSPAASQLKLASPSSSGCSTILIRKEYSTLSPVEKLSYANALRCVRSKPSRFKTDPHFNAADDWTLLHIRMVKYVHFTAFFTVFHRGFTAIIERDLVECGLEPGLGLPWVDWTKTSDDPSTNAFFSDDANWGLGTDGKGDSSDCAYGRGKAVIDGTLSDHYFNAPFRHRLCREFNNLDTHHPNPHFGSNCSTFINSNFVSGLGRTHDDGKFFDFSSALEISSHLSMHTCVGGNMAWLSTSPNDNVFHSHHGFVDNIYSSWQQKSEKNRMAFHGPKQQQKGGKHPPWDAKRTDVINFQPLAENVSVQELLDHKGGSWGERMCYDYDYLIPM